MVPAIWLVVLGFEFRAIASELSAAGRYVFGAFRTVAAAATLGGGLLQPAVAAAILVIVYTVLRRSRPAAA